MVGLLPGCAPPGHDRVTHVFVQHTFPLVNDVGHLGEVIIQKGNERLGLELFGD